MKSYKQFCPVAKAAEIVSERWTLLILRELLMGSVRFSDLQRGLGSISPSVLTDRLRTLEDDGIVFRRMSRRDGKWEYHLTDAGRALLPVVEAAGVWGYRWLRQTFAADELDIDLLMLDISRRIRPERLPKERAVIEFEFTDLDSKYRNWWLLVDNSLVDLCYEPPERQTDIRLQSTLETMTRIWMRDTAIADARRRKLLVVSGDDMFIRTLADWFVGSYVAELAAAPDQD